MSDELEFDSVDKITIGALGPPGRRTFYLQARSGLQLVSLVLEKDHVLSLAEGTEEIFKSSGYPEDSLEWDADSMALEEPVSEAFRVGTLVLGYAESRDLVLIECQERADPDIPSAESSARFWITRAQLEALSGIGVAVASQGRPICPLCRVPMDPDGHVCYASNGHRSDH